MSAMERTTTMMSSRFSSSGSTLSSLAKLSSTNANSPPWASMKPVRMASALQQPAIQACDFAYRLNLHAI